MKQATRLLCRAGSSSFGLRLQSWPPSLRNRYLTEPPAIDAACGNDQVSTQEKQHMGIAAIFRGDRFRLVSGSHCQTSENARQFRHKSCSGWRKRRADSLRPAIAAACGHDRLATQVSGQMDITSLLQSDRGRVVLPESSKFPGNSSKGSRTRKKFADSDPFRSETPGKTPFSDSQSGPRCTQKRSKQRQRLRVIAAAAGYSGCCSRSSHRERSFHRLRSASPQGLVPHWSVASEAATIRCEYP